MNVNMKEMVDKATMYREFWKLLFPPECDIPSERQFFIWVSTFADMVVERGIRRTALKYVKGGLSADQVGRYASGVMRNASMEQQQAVQQSNSVVTPVRGFSVQ